MCACDAENVDVEKFDEDAQDTLSEFLTESDDLCNARKILRSLSPKRANGLCNKLLDVPQASTNRYAVSAFLDVNGWDLLVDFFELRARVRCCA